MLVSVVFNPFSLLRINCFGLVPLLVLISQIINSFRLQSLPSEQLVVIWTVQEMIVSRTLCEYF